MKFFKWIIFIPAALLANYLAIIVTLLLLSLLGYIFNFMDVITLTPSKYSNPLNPNKPFIITLIAGIIGIGAYFIVGNIVLELKGITIKQSKIGNNFLLLFTTIFSIISGIIKFSESEIALGIISIAQIIAGVFFFKQFKKE